MCRPGWGPMVPARLAWILQESPSALVPLFIVLTAPAALRDAMPWEARLASSAFITHYLHRAFLHPMMTRPSKLTPLVPALLAFMFCNLNGAMQVCPLCTKHSFSSMLSFHHATVMLVTFCPSEIAFDQRSDQFPSRLQCHSSLRGFENRCTIPVLLKTKSNNDA
jgi:hypothetical protein